VIFLFIFFSFGLLDVVRFFFVCCVSFLFLSYPHPPVSICCAICIWFIFYAVLFRHLHSLFLLYPILPFSFSSKPPVYIFIPVPSFSLFRFLSSWIIIPSMHHHHHHTSSASASTATTTTAAYLHHTPFNSLHGSSAPTLRRG